MAFRSRSRGRRAPRKRAIWVNIPFGAVAFTESVGQQLLLTAEDWEAQFTGLAFESATLRTIVGEICLAQTTVGTAGGNAFWGIYLADNNVTAPVPTFTTSGMSEVSWLTTGILATQSTVTGNQQSTRQIVIPIHVKAKRKLTSRDGIFISAQFGSDAATPAGVISGLLRFLIARD